MGIDDGKGLRKVADSRCVLVITRSIQCCRCRRCSECISVERVVRWSGRRTCVAKKTTTSDCMSQSGSAWAQPGFKVVSASPGRNRRKEFSSGQSNLSLASDLRS